MDSFHLLMRRQLAKTTYLDVFREEISLKINLKRKEEIYLSPSL